MEFVLNHPDTGKATVLLIFDGVPYEADSDHVWWEEIIDLLLEDDERVVDLFPKRDFQRASEYREDPALEPLVPRWRAQDHEAGETDPALPSHEGRWQPTAVKTVDSPVGPIEFTVTLPEDKPPEQFKCGYCGCPCGTPVSFYEGDSQGNCGCGQSEFAGDKPKDDDNPTLADEGWPTGVI